MGRPGRLWSPFIFQAALRTLRGRGPFGRTEGRGQPGEVQLPECVSKGAPSLQHWAVPRPPATTGSSPRMGPRAGSQAHAAPRALVHISKPPNNVTATSVSSLRPDTAFDTLAPNSAECCQASVPSLTTVAGKETNPGAPLPTSPANSAPPGPQAPRPTGPASAQHPCVTSRSWPSLLQAPTSH